MTNFSSATALAPNLSASDQIGPGDIRLLAGLGYTDIVCHRPDAEHPSGPGSSQLARLAAAEGMTFHYLPITPGQPFGAEAEALAGIVARPGAKVFAYCRSGQRARNAWTLAQSQPR